MPVKPEVKEWLKEHDVWTASWRRRDEYKADGDTPIVAQRKALAEFYCPDDLEAVAPARAPTAAANP